MLDLLKSAFRNLGRKRFRTSLTILGISIGVTSVIVIGNISQCGSAALTTELESLGLSGISVSAVQESGSSLTNQDLKVVKECATVEQATPVMMQTSDVSTQRVHTKALLWGIDSSAKQTISLQILYGRIFNQEDVSSGSNVCLVDEAFSQKAYQRNNIVGKKIHVDCNGTNEEFEVIGIVKTGSGLLQNIIGDYIPTFLYIPYTTAQNLTGRTGFDQIAVKVKYDENVDRVGQTILSALNRSNGTTNAFQTGNLSKQRDGLNSMLNIVTWILSAVGAISLLVASLSIMTVMLVSVSERTREIGIKKAIGAKRRTIMIEFMFEAILISVLGCFLGLAAGYGISFAGAALLGIQLSIRMDIMALSIGFSLITGTIFGVYPAYKAACLDPVIALRQNS